MALFRYYILALHDADAIFMDGGVAAIPHGMILWYYKLTFEKHEDPPAKRPRPPTYHNADDGVPAEVVNKRLRCGRAPAALDPGLGSEALLGIVVLLVKMRRRLPL